MYFSPRILVLGLLMGAAWASAADAPDPRQRVIANSERLFAINTKSESGHDNQAYVEGETQKTLSDIVDYSAIARGVYGKSNRDKLSVNQDQRFQLEFERSMVQLVAQALMGMEISETVVHDAKLIRDTRAQVPVVVSTKDRQTFEFLFSLALTDGDWRVRNIIVNGVNLGLTYRNQFSELMKEHSDDVDAVIAAWSESVTEAGPDHQ